MGATLDTTNYLISATVMISVLSVDSTDYDELDRVINSASWFANTFTCRNLRSRAYSGTDGECYYNGDGTDTFILRQYPCTTISALYIDVDRAYAAADLVSSDDYYLDAAGRVLTLDGLIFDAGGRSVKLEHTAGYSTIPWDLQQATKELCIYLWDRWKNKRVGKSTLSNDAGSVNYETDYPATVLGVLRRYRNMARGMA